MLVEPRIHWRIPRKQPPNRTLMSHSVWMTRILVGGFNPSWKHMCHSRNKCSQWIWGVKIKKACNWKKHHLNFLNFFQVQSPFPTKILPTSHHSYPFHPLQITTFFREKRHLSLHQWPAARGLTLCEFHLEDTQENASGGGFRHGDGEAMQKWKYKKDQGIHPWKLTNPLKKTFPIGKACLPLPPLNRGRNVKLPGRYTLVN